MPQAATRMIKHAGATFIEIPNVDFCGREILVRLLPTDNPAHVAVECMKQLAEFGSRAQLAPISENIVIPKKKKVIQPN